jgi:3-deoxy-manno-octulosonate cytidylyltransferase (CMP-KDO synthetase)
MSRIIGIIPARYASTRFPAKALADVQGKSMIQRVYEQAVQAPKLNKIIVATDHPLIYDHVRAFGAEVLMTSSQHPSGTDRCYEALSLQAETYDYVLNIQGDEPFIQPDQISLLADLLDGEIEIATLVRVVEDAETLFNPNTPKVVLNQANEALYFSRATIPYLRGIEPAQWLHRHTFYRHIGMYAYRSDVLAQLTKLPASSLENAEALEQLRWLQNGFRIKVALTPHDSWGIDTPEDLEKVLRVLAYSQP